MLNTWSSKIGLKVAKFLEWPRQTWEVQPGEHGQIFLLDQWLPWMYNSRINVFRALWRSEEKVSQETICHGELLCNSWIEQHRLTELWLPRWEERRVLQLIGCLGISQPRSQEW